MGTTKDYSKNVMQSLDEVEPQRGVKLKFYGGAPLGKKKKHHIGKEVTRAQVVRGAEKEQWGRSEAKIKCVATYKQ